MSEYGYEDFGSSEAAERTDLHFAAGLPSFYAAATIQETLAEYARAAVLSSDFEAPSEIREFLQEHLFNATPDADPSIDLYRRGKALRLNGDYRTANTQLSSAIEHDEDFAEAYIERGRALGASNQLEKAIEDFTRALALMSEYDWQLYLPYQHRGIALAMGGNYDKALDDLLEAQRLSPNASGLATAIDQVKFMLDNQDRYK